MEQLKFKYQEKIATPEILEQEKVDSLLSELDIYLEGYFLGISLSEKVFVVVPYIDKMFYTVGYDGKFTRINLEISVILEYDGNIKKNDLYTKFLEGIFTFVGARFQVKDENARGKERF